MKGVPSYQELYPEGSKVRVADRGILLTFQREWALHHELAPEQIEFAGRVAVVRTVEYYHGGDVLYRLDGVPGTWHEACLRKG